MLVICINCGANIPQEMVECEFCGSRVDAMRRANYSQYHEETDELGSGNDVPSSDLESMIAGLTSKSRDILYFDDHAEGVEKAKRGAQNKYLYKLGYSPNEKILLLYDNAVIKTGESGFTITDKGMYSSGFFLGDTAFFIPLDRIETISLEDNSLVVNERKVEIVLIDNADYQTLRDIVAKIVFINK